MGKNGEQATYTTGKWSSSDPLIATINEDTGVVATTGTKVGTVTFTFTADNGTEDPADDVTGQSKPYTVTAGDSLALVIPDGASIVTRVNQPATVLWSSNAALMAPNKEFNYRIDLYEGNYANEAALSGRNPVATYTAGKDKNSVRIQENVLSKLSSGNTPAYTVLCLHAAPQRRGRERPPVGTCLDHRAGTACHSQADTAPEHLPQGYRRRRQYQLVGGKHH